MIKQGLRLLRGLLNRAGFDVQRLTVHGSRDVHLIRVLDHFGIDLVLDVGANAGQYGAGLCRFGYRGQIVSFEPLEHAHRELERAAAASKHWRVAPRMALGAEDAEIDIHVAGNSVSSSILAMLPTHVRAAPGSAYVRSEKVRVRRLDAVAREYLDGCRRVLLKIDTQGYEDHVLTGAAGILDRIAAVQVELSLVPLYAGQRLMDEMRARIESAGFELFAIFPGYVDESSGRTLQLDGLFVRRALLGGDPRG